jgi:hypothetical protein
VNTPSDQRQLEERALELWREREMEFPAFTRRMTPDAIDRMSGAWSRIVAVVAATRRSGIIDIE